MSDEEDVLNRASQRIGTVLRGKYRLDAVLGIGGMAVVYAATHRNQKRFAVKVLHAELAVRSEFRARFVREGYVANAVAHDGVVSVLDDDVDETGMAFLVMDLLEGADVERLRSRADGQLSLQSALTVVAEVLGVLEAAHARGVVHRDLKPANFFVVLDGSVKVLDFGVAQLRDGAPALQATRSGAVLGTPAFMAPEQASAQHRDVEARTDVWALGASLFTLLSGQFVHEAENGGQTLIRAATKPARSLASVAPHLPACVIELVDRALMFEKGERWESAAAMRGALLAVHRELFGELSREPLRACLVGVEAPRVHVSPSAISALGKSETTADSPAAVPFDAERTPTSSVSDSIARVARSQARHQRKRALRLLAVAAALVVVAVAVSLSMRVMSSARVHPVAAVAPVTGVSIAQMAVALPLAPTRPATVAASVQTASDALPAPPSRASVSPHVHASRPSPQGARTTRAPSATAPIAPSTPASTVPVNPLDLELQ